VKYLFCVENLSALSLQKSKAPTVLSQNHYWKFLLSWSMVRMAENLTLDMM